MRQNPARRTALLDAAIEVLADEGSRGLTLRAVDQQAEVPTGTTSNYFSNRADLLEQLMLRVRERLTPDPSDLAETMRATPSRDLVKTLMHQLVDRTRRERSSHLALLELRLEATRRPELDIRLTRFFTSDLDENVAFHVNAGLPGDRGSVLLLYLGMLGLIVDDLTVPEVLRPHGVDALVDSLVDRVFPPSAETGGEVVDQR
jgi:AcrR family transcriptional regulator